MYKDGDDKRKKLTPEERLAKKKILEESRPAVGVKRGDMMRGRVYNITEDGAFVQTDEKNIGFIHHSEKPHNLREGMMVEARVTFVRADGRVNLSLLPLKQDAMVVDAEKILQYLRQRKGAMPFNDDTAPEIIREKFGISKSSFKRALGRLLKEKAIKLEDGWVILLEQESPVS